MRNVWQHFRSYLHWWRHIDIPDKAWQPTGIRQIYSGYDEQKAEAAAKRARDRYVTAETLRIRNRQESR